MIQNTCGHSSNSIFMRMPLIKSWMIVAPDSPFTSNKAMISDGVEFVTDKTIQLSLDADNSV